MDIDQKYLDRAISYTYRDDNGCLISRYAKNSRGYPLMKIGKDSFLVHRLTWIGAYGPIPEYMTVDHKDCNRPGCVEPTHLQLLTKSQNRIKSSASSAWRPGVCKRGHPDSFRVPAINRRPNGELYETSLCSECRRERRRGKVSPTI